MYRLLVFTDYTWIPGVVFDDLEDALAVAAPMDTPWRVQEWIDIRNGPAEAGFWHDVAYWIDGREYRSTTERMT